MELLQNLSHLPVILLNASAILLEFSVSVDASQLWNWNCKQKYYIFIHSGNWESPFWGAAKKWHDLVNQASHCLILKAVWGSSEKGGSEVAFHFCWLFLAIRSRSILHGSQLESFWVFQWNPFFFLLPQSELRLCWRGFSFSEGGNFEKMLALKFKSFLVGRTDSWQWWVTLAGLL